MLELLIVLVLIGLLLVVTVPALRNTLIDDPLRASGRKLIGYITGVRDKAVLEQQSYMLYIDIDENRLWHLPEVEAGEGLPPETGILLLAKGMKLRDIWTKATGTITSGVQEVWVSRQGYLDQTVLHLDNGEGEGLSLLVLSFLPAIEVRDGYYEPE